MQRSKISTSASDVISMNFDNQIILGKELYEKIKVNSVFFKSIIIPRDHFMNNLDLVNINRLTNKGFIDLLKTKAITVAFLPDETRLTFHKIWEKRNQEGWYDAIKDVEYLHEIDDVENEIGGFDYVTVDNTERKKWTGKLIAQYFKQLQELDDTRDLTKDDFDKLEDFANNVKPISRSQAYSDTFQIPGTGTRNFFLMDKSKKKVKECVDISHGFSLAKQFKSNFEYIDKSWPFLLSESEKSSIDLEFKKKIVRYPNFKNLGLEDIAYIRSNRKFEESRESCHELINKIKISWDEITLEELLQCLADYLAKLSEDPRINSSTNIIEGVLSIQSKKYNVRTIGLNICSANIVPKSTISYDLLTPLWQLIFDVEKFDTMSDKKKTPQRTQNTFDTGFSR